jgi:hypothetical protein
MAQRTRVTGNLVHDNVVDLYMEVNHGPFLIDHNLFLSKESILDWSQGSAYVHNLMGSISVWNSPESLDARGTPWFQSHRQEGMKLNLIRTKDAQYRNNLLPKSTEAFSDPQNENLQDIGNADLCVSQVKLEEKPDGMWITLPQGFNWPEVNRSLITTDVLGKAIIPDVAFEQPDGTPYRLDTDYFGNKRNGENPAPGPFCLQSDGALSFKVWPKD